MVFDVVKRGELGQLYSGLEQQKTHLQYTVEGWIRYHFYNRSYVAQRNQVTYPGCLEKEVEKKPSLPSVISDRTILLQELPAANPSQISIGSPKVRAQVPIHWIISLSSVTWNRFIRGIRKTGSKHLFDKRLQYPPCRAQPSSRPVEQETFRALYVLRAYA